MCVCVCVDGFWGLRWDSAVVGDGYCGTGNGFWLLGGL